MSDALEHLPGQNRYVFSVDGEQVGLTDYWISGDAIHLAHTEIDPPRRGRGLGARMVRSVIEEVRAETEYRVVPDCPFVADWLRLNPEYQHLTSR